MSTLQAIPTALTFTQHTRIPPDYIEPLHKILIDSFSPSSLGDYDKWVAGYAEGKWWLYLAELDHKLIGFGNVLPRLAERVHLLEYLAVSPSYRNQSVGAGLLRYITQSLRERGNADGMIIEVDSDDDGTEAERALRKRRIGFYKRNGAHLVECAPQFRVPSMTGGAPLPEKLMWIPLRADAETPRGVRLRDCLLRLYEVDYGMSADDGLVQEALNKLAC